MAIEIRLQGNLIVPVVACDECGRLIESDDDGVYGHEARVGTTAARVRFFHWYCFGNVDARAEEGTAWGANKIGILMAQLGRNLGMDWEQTFQCAEDEHAEEYGAARSRGRRERDRRFITATRRQRQAISPTVRFSILKRDGYTCRYCGATPPDVRLEVDHVVAVSVGGTNDETNLVTACRECNIGKRARAP